MDMSTQRSCPSSTASLTASTIASCTTVATFDSAAPATAAGSVVGSACARLPMVATTAVLDTKPPNNPEMGKSGARADQPLRDVAGCVHQHDQHRELPDQARIDHFPGIDGLVRQQGQHQDRGGREQHRVAQLLVGELQRARTRAAMLRDTSSTTTSTPAAAASMGCEAASTPMMKVASSAISVVRPGSTPWDL